MWLISTGSTYVSSIRKERSSAWTLATSPAKSMTSHCWIGSAFNHTSVCMYYAARWATFIFQIMQVISVPLRLSICVGSNRKWGINVLSGLMWTTIYVINSPPWIFHSISVENAHAANSNNVQVFKGVCNHSFWLWTCCWKACAPRQRNAQLRFQPKACNENWLQSALIQWNRSRNGHISLKRS